MALIAYLRAYLALFIQYRDHAAAKRSGQVAALLYRKRVQRSRALRGR